MSTQQINIRIDSDLATALDRVAEEESLDRATAIRKLLEKSIRSWELEHAVIGVQRGDISLGRAAEESGLSTWELLDALRVGGVGHPLTADDARARLERFAGSRETGTLPDIPPRPEGVLLVGINPAPVSVAAGHYYQGRLGRRLWRRLERVGLLDRATPGAEDEAFAAAGHGLTDLVKRPTPSADLLSARELDDGVETLRDKIREWQPGLVLFAFRAPAERLLGRNVAPGRCGEFEGTPAFLLTGPYAAAAEAARIDDELRTLLATASGSPARHDTELTQPITPNDIARGQIRLPRGAKRFFPARRAELEVVLNGNRVHASYDPRLGADRERSAVLRIGTALGDLIEEPGRLVVSRGTGGVPRLDFAGPTALERDRPGRS